MIVQFFRYGGGLSKGPLNYLLGKDRKREHASLLIGNEKEVSELIDSSPFQKKYTSGCLSFYEDDLPEENKRKIMQEFEQCLFPGLTPDNYRVLWIEHKDKFNPQTGKNRLELNFLIPNVEILTGKRLQPFYHVADLPRVDLFKKKVNFEFSLHDPNNPENQQATTLQKNLPKDVKEFKQRLNHYAEIALIEGQIHDRSSMKMWLEELGYVVTKEAPKSLSIKNPYGDEKRPIRLTGLIYEQNFRAREAGTSITAKASETYRANARSRYESDIQRYREQLERKSRELEGKYQFNEDGNTHLSEPIHRPSVDSSQPNLRTGIKENDGGLQPSDKSAKENDIELIGKPESTDGRKKSYLGKIQPIEPRSNGSNYIQKNTYKFERSSDFTSSCISYYLHVHSRLEHQRKTASSTHTGRKTGEKQGVSRLALEYRADAENYEIGAQYDFRSPVISNYQRAAIAAEAATGHTRRSIEFIKNAVTDDKELRTIASSSFADRENLQRLIPSDFGKTVIGDVISAIRRSIDQATATAFKHLIGWVNHQGADQSGYRSVIAEFGATRDTEANKAISGSNNHGIELGRVVSKGIAEIDTDTVFKALGKLENRREQARKASLDFQSNSPHI
jgi:hypothetical protein